MMLTNLIKFLKFKILDLLDDIGPISLTCQSLYMMCKSDEFWRYKIHINYGNIANEKPDSISYKEWYMRIYNSGTVWIESEDNTRKKTQLDIQNVWKFKQCYYHNYFIDIWGKLYYYRHVKDNGN